LRQAAGEDTEEGPYDPQEDMEGVRGLTEPQIVSPPQEPGNEEQLFDLELLHDDSDREDEDRTQQFAMKSYETESPDAERCKQLLDTIRKSQNLDLSVTQDDIIKYQGVNCFFVMDREKAMVTALKRVMPEADYFNCVVHLHEATKRKLQTVMIPKKKFRDNYDKGMRFLCK
jgi:hypothetical protein